MAKNLFDLFIATCQKAGVNTTGEAFTKIKDVASGFEFDDAVATAISGLMTEDAAKNNSTIKGYFTAQALNGVDAALKIALTEGGFSADAIKAIMETETNTFKRPALALAKLKEMTAETGGDDKSKKRIEELQASINALNTEKATLAQTYEQQLAAKTSEIEGQQVNFALQTKFGALAKNPGIPAKIWDKVAFEAFQEKLGELGAKLILKDGKPLVVQASDPTLALHFENKPLTLDSIVEMVAKENSLTAASDGNKPKESGSAGGGANPPAGSEGASANSALLDALKESKESFGIGQQ